MTWPNIYWEGYQCFNEENELDESQGQAPGNENSSNPNEIIAEGKVDSRLRNDKGRSDRIWVWLDMHTKRDGEVKDDSRNLPWATSSM